VNHFPQQVVYFHTNTALYRLDKGRFSPSFFLQEKIYNSFFTSSGCFATNNTISGWLSVSKRIIAKNNKMLKDRGFITTSKRGKLKVKKTTNKADGFHIGGINIDFLKSAHKPLTKCIAIFLYLLRNNYNFIPDLIICDKLDIDKRTFKKHFNLLVESGIINADGTFIRFIGPNRGEANLLRKGVPSMPVSDSNNLSRSCSNGNSIRNNNFNQDCNNTADIDNIESDSVCQVETMQNNKVTGDLQNSNSISNVKKTNKQESLTNVELDTYMHEAKELLVSSDFSFITKVIPNQEEMDKLLKIISENLKNDIKQEIAIDVENTVFNCIQAYRYVSWVTMHKPIKPKNLISLAIWYYRNWPSLEGDRFTDDYRNGSVRQAQAYFERRKKTIDLKHENGILMVTGIINNKVNIKSNKTDIETPDMQNSDGSAMYDNFLAEMKKIFTEEKAVQMANTVFNR
jgi:hypothetical protein